MFSLEASQKRQSLPFSCFQFHNGVYLLINDFFCFISIQQGRIITDYRSLVNGKFMFSNFLLKPRLQLKTIATLFSLYKPLKIHICLCHGDGFLDTYYTPIIPPDRSHRSSTACNRHNRQYSQVYTAASRFRTRPCSRSIPFCPH